MSKSSYLIFVAMATCAHGAQLAGPVSGIVYDAPSRSLRVVLGVPGASYLGHPAFSNVDAAAVSPDGRSVLMVREGTLLLGRGIETAEPSWTVLEEETSAPSLMTWSDDSVWAVAISGQRARAWSQFGESRNYELLGIPAVAVIDGTGRLLSGIESEGLHVLDGHSSRLLARMENPSAIAISGATLFAADRARNEVFEIRDYAGSADVLTFAAELDPAGLAISANGALLLVASQSERTLASYSIASRERVSLLELDFNPSRLARFSPALFLMNTAEAGVALQVLDARNTPSVYFIPAGSVGSEE